MQISTNFTTSLFQSQSHLFNNISPTSFLQKSLFLSKPTKKTLQNLLFSNPKSNTKKNLTTLRTSTINASLLEAPLLWAGRLCVFYALLKAGLAGSQANPLVSDLESGGVSVGEGGDLGFSKWLENIQGKPEILATPISTVAVEQAFSLGGNILEARRSSLHPSTLEATTCVDDWTRADMRQQGDADDDFEDLFDLLHLAPNSPDAKVFQGFSNLTQGHSSTPATIVKGNSSNGSTSADAKSDGGRARKWLGLEIICGVLACIFFTWCMT